MQIEHPRLRFLRISHNCFLNHIDFLFVFLLLRCNETCRNQCLYHTDNLLCFYFYRPRINILHNLTKREAVREVNRVRWTEGQTEKQKNERTNEWTDDQTKGRKYGWPRYGCIKELTTATWIDGWVDGWTDGRAVILFYSQGWFGTKMCVYMGQCVCMYTRTYTNTYT